MISVGEGYNTLMDENLNLAGNTEIEKALKEFEAQNNSVPVGTKQEIPSVLTATPKSYLAPETPKMVQLVMKWFGFKEQKQAEYVLLGFAIVVIGISLFLFFSQVNGGKKVEFSPKVLEDMQKASEGL